MERRRFETRHERKLLLGGAREVTAAPGAAGLHAAWKRTTSPASIVQVPVASNVTLVPVTMQMLVVADVNATVRPDDAVAASVSGEAEREAFVSAAKLIVWLACVIVPDTVAPVAVAGTPWLSLAWIA